MTLARVVLGLSVLIWLPYGLFCLVQPGYLADAAGVQATSATGTTEIRAMYGGLQAALGLLALGGFLRDDLRRPALVALLFLASGLALARLGGLLVDGGFSAYTAGGLGFEIATLSFAALALRNDG